MTSGTMSSFVLFLVSCTSVMVQSQATQQVQFNQVLNVNGDMQLNSFQFPDRSRIETFSQKQQQIIVNQQTPAIPANQVTGTTGQPFVAISPQSMVVSTNGATDLVGGQIQMAMSQQILQTVAVQPDNTFVAMLSPDRQTWMIQETMRSINSTDMTVRMVKRNQLDGEYMIVGRQTVEVNTLVQPFGSTVAIQGSGLQENEYQDGFRMSTRATQPVAMVVDVKDGIDPSMLAGLQGQSSINDYRYSVVTNLGAVTPELNQQVTVVQMPINAIRIQKMMQAMGVPPTGQVAIAVAQRGVLQNPGGATGNIGGAAGAIPRRLLRRDGYRREVTRQVQAAQPQAQPAQAQPAQAQPAQAQPAQAQPVQNQNGQAQTGQTQASTPTTGNNPVAAQLLLAPTFTPIQANAALDQTNMRIAIPVRQIDGEFILTMQMMRGVQAIPAEGQGAAPRQSSTPVAVPDERSNGTTSAASGASNSTASATEKGGKKAERRQDSGKDRYGSVKAPQGAIIMTMKMIDDMAESVKWGGQAAVTQMMNEYVKAQTGSELFAVGEEKKNGGGDIVAKMGM